MMQALKNKKYYYYYINYKKKYFLTVYAAMSLNVFPKNMHNTHTFFERVNKQLLLIF